VQARTLAGVELTPVTALLLTRRDFPREIAANYEQACKMLCVEPAAKGYGLVLALDDHGGRWTRITRSTSDIGTFLALDASGIVHGLDVDPADVVRDMPGWPVTCTLGLLDRPMPRNPATDRPILRSPTGEAARAAAHRVTVAALAEELEVYRSRRDHEQAWYDDAHNFGDYHVGPPPLRMVDLACEPDPEQPRETGFQAELAAVAAEPKPRGVTVRKMFAGARVLRVDRPGWSLVARLPDGPHIVVFEDGPPLVDVTRLDPVAGHVARLADPGSTTAAPP